jgi:hypothetical protein
VIDALPAWFYQSGPPNWVFLVALLTAPARWAGYARRVMSRAWGGRGE